jgi:NAD(P)-dependent dehydrogenase (short-subunit alcohol dehydrogenase family)
MSQKTAIVIGVGAERGLGGKLCRRFAARGLHVLVAGRTFDKVQRVVEDIQADGGQATPVETDAAVEAQVIALFDRAEQIGPVDLAIYNAGGAMPGDLKTMEAAYFELCWRIACFGGFLFGRETARRMAPRGAGTLLFTGASASMRGKPFFAAFTAAKAGLRAFAQSMAREFQPQGIHVGHVVIDGAIDGDRFVLGRPDIAKALGDDGMIDLEGIVDVYEFLYDQPRRAWSHEIDVRTFKETF